MEFEKGERERKTKTKTKRGERMQNEEGVK